MKFQCEAKINSSDCSAILSCAPLSVQFNLFISLFTLNSIDKLDQRKVVVLSLSPLSLWFAPDRFSLLNYCSTWGRKWIHEGKARRSDVKTMISMEIWKRILVWTFPEKLHVGISKLFLSEVTVEEILATQPENCPDGFKRCFCVIRSARSITHRPLLLVFVGEPRQKIQQWRLNSFHGTSKVS